MNIDADGHLFETEEVFEKYMEPALRKFRPRLLADDDGHNFWVVDGSTAYQRPSIPGAFSPGTAAPPGGSVAVHRRASEGSQTLSNVKERLADLDKEGIDTYSVYLYTYIIVITDGIPEITSLFLTATGKWRRDGRQARMALLGRC